MREKKFWKLINEILTYLIFITLLIFVANSYHDMNSYKYRKSLDNLLIDDEFKKVSIFIHLNLYYFTFFFDIIRLRQSMIFGNGCQTILLLV